MTTVNTTTPTNAAASQTASTSRTTLANNFETFLTLLTAQLKNQDPLSPLDTKDFTNQLVQFSGIEQQIKTNDLLTSMSQTTKLSAGATAVAYLGKEATATSALAATTTNGGTASWRYELPRSATSTTLKVIDTRGRTIATVAGETSTGEKVFNWNGKDQAGNPAPAGTYRLEINSTGADGRAIAGTIRQTGLITGVDLSGTTPTITLAGAAVPLSSVIKIGLQAN
ncbi:basal-body rod modification protein FlgD [Candidatus Phycosocius bacilliformis]|uniref:Basal-body rod modification protein FlgD n=1 Tax=Candidatus Phycosocius bacilliformis TaxID=1445552 RepID=A0A2P2EC33_9PROT|nr:flagellar hook capping FlgD N-terminal domain-containing protein [Candidatus Phycosocius bacilliformis]GBF58619.1 basal-body rod modification protein FlgD [Candidatus Phycosocius bacilliformis]